MAPVVILPVVRFLLQIQRATPRLKKIEHALYNLKASDTRRNVATGLFKNSYETLGHGTSIQLSK